MSVQQDKQACPFTAAAYALDFYIKDSNAAAMDTRKLGGSVDAMFPSVIRDCFALADRFDSRAASLQWLHDFCISCAMHADEIVDFLEKIKSENQDELPFPSLPRDRRRVYPFPVPRAANLPSEDLRRLDQVRAVR